MTRGAVVSACCSVEFPGIPVGRYKFSTVAKLHAAVTLAGTVESFDEESFKSNLYTVMGMAPKGM